MTLLMLLTAPPTSRLAWHSVTLAQKLQKHAQIKVFFYQDAVMIANQLRWQPADQANLAQAWRDLKIDLPVCVSAALFRGISDPENAQRHKQTENNLADGFRLTGLGELAEALLDVDRVIQL